MHNLETLLMAGVGILIITGAKHLRDEGLALLARLLTPRPPEPPITERVYCIGCRRLVKHEAMGWDGHRFVCDDCAPVEAV